MKLEHVAMYVKDLEGAKDFFMSYFGANPSAKYHNEKTNFSSYFLTFDGGARLEIMNINNMVESEKAILQTGYVHIAFSVGSKEQVDAISAKLDKDGYELLSGPRTTGDGYYESCLIGFEGSLIEITV